MSTKMTGKFLIAAALFLLSVLPAGSFAAEESTYSQMFQKISDINKIQPMQNPGFERGSKILRWNILDSRSRVVGEIKDIALSDAGNVETLQVAFNRMQKETPINLSYREQGIRPASRGYIANFAADELETLYPTFLAGIDTAAGDTSDQVNLSRMIGTKVSAEDGRTIGVVEEVLFSGKGERAEALLIDIKTGTLRGDKVAVPFSYVKFSQGILAFQGKMSTDATDAFLNYAETK